MSTSYVYLGLVAITYAYDNLALFKPAYQQYPFPIYTQIPPNLTQASNAVDGLMSDLEVFGGQCVISANNKRTATWWVNLTSIHHITIYYRTGNVEWGPTNGYTSRFLGFSLYVSNTTNKSDGTLCFKDTNFTLSTIPAVLNTTCTEHGQYVIYYNERLTGIAYPDGYSTYAYNELCEVEVYGCSEPGSFGANCSITCPDPHCLYCDSENGSCQGCKPGYQGHHCELECPYGFFGNGCVNKCSEKCNGCNNANGSCDYGCRAGLTGSTCEERFQYGTFGHSCTEICGHCRDQNECHKVNGSCLIGCEDGYRGDLCDSICENGTFGHECNCTCGHFKDDELCYHINGTCLNGCRSGYIGHSCKKKCSAGYYGEHCSNICGNCFKGDSCNHVNGFCSRGCDPGYQGSFCTEACENGMYGVNCNKTCGHCRDGQSCYHANGTCLNGCNLGYFGDLCMFECSPGNYGENCSSTCKICPHGESCHHVNGSCLQGLFRNENKCNTDSKTGLYVAVVTQSILLAIAVVVIFLQNFTETQTLMSWRRSKSQTCSRSDPQNSNFNAFEEMHQYATMDSTPDSYYQNIVKPNQCAK